MESYEHNNSNQSYMKSWELLEKHYGSEYKIASAYSAKLHQCQAEAMIALPLFVLDCHHYPEGLTTRNQMESQKEIMNVINKLLFRLKDMWRSKTHRLLENYGNLLI